MASRDRWLLAVLCAILVLLTGLGSGRSRENPADVRRSTFLNTPGGARALYLALGELGVRVGRRTLPYDASHAVTEPQVLLDPADPPSAAEWGRLLRYVRGGGTLVAATRDQRSGDSLGLVVRLTYDGPLSSMVRWQGDTALAVPHRWTVGAAPVPGVRMAFADTSPALRLAGARPLLRTRRGAVAAVAYPLGRGTVVALSDAAPLGNGRLRDGGAALLLARIAADATRGGRTLRFDEYHQGFSDDASPTDALGRFLAGTAPGHALLQLAFAGLALLFLLGRRFGAPLEPAPALRRSPLEHVEALAGAYRQAGARATARRLVVAGLARRLGRKPLHEAAGEADVVERITARLPVAREAAQALQEEWNRGPRGDLVALARNVDRLLDEVKKP